MREAMSSFSIGSVWKEWKYCLGSRLFCCYFLALAVVSMMSFLVLAHSSTVLLLVSTYLCLTFSVCRLVSKVKLDRLSALLVSLCRPASQDTKLKSAVLDGSAEPLLNIVNAVGAEALNIAYQAGSMEHTRLFARMLRTANGRSLLRHSLQADFSGSYVKDVQSELPQLSIFTGFDSMTNVPDGHEAEVFLQWVVLPWLAGQHANVSGMLKLSIVEVVFATAMHAPADDRLRLLDQVCDMCGQDVVVLCAMVRQAVVWLQDAQSGHSSLMQQWLASHTLGEKLIVQVWKAANAASPPLAFSADLTIYENSEVPDSSLTAELTIWHSVQLLLRPGPSKGQQTLGKYF